MADPKTPAEDPRDPSYDPTDEPLSAAPAETDLPGIGPESPNGRVKDAPQGFVDLEDEPGTIGSEAGEYFTTPEESEQARLRVHDAQVALVSLAFLDPNRISDVWDLATKDALAEFQEEHGFPVTGQLGLEEYEQLLGAYEAGLEVQSRDEVADDFDPVHPDEPLSQE